MRRRSILIALSAALLAGLAVAGVTLAGQGDGGGGDATRAERSSAPAGHTRVGPAHFRRGAHGKPGHRGGQRRLFGPLRLAVRGFAERLDVTPKRLREAMRGVKRRQLDRAVSDGVITGAERSALEGCMKARRARGARCDGDRARSAHRKLQRKLHSRTADLARAKQLFFADLAAELGKPQADVERAARAELAELLERAVDAGFVTDRGRDLALACFDTPADCDRGAVRRELRPRLGGHGFGHRRGHR